MALQLHCSTCEALMADLVRNLLSTSTRQFAVISLRGEPLCERLVIPYSGEKSLRNVIAASNILTLGCRTREEAEANIDRCTTRAYTSPRKLPAVLVARTLHCIRKLAPSHQFPGWRSNFPQTWSFARDRLHHGFNCCCRSLCKNVSPK